MSTSLVPAPADTIDLADVGRSLRHGWRAVIGFTLLGAIAAAAVLLFAPPKFTSSTSVLIRAGTEGGSSLLSKLAGGMAEGAGGLLSGAVKSPIETELQILSSRAVAGHVVDSLHLQVRVKAPRGVPAADIIQASALGGSFKTRTYHFAKDGGAYSVTGLGNPASAPPGTPVVLPAGTITLRAGQLPEAFDLEIRDREDAITRFQKNLSVDKAAGGEIARVSYRGDDSLTAAAAANALVSVYLARRATTDRGTTQHRVEFLSAQSDSAAAALDAAAGRLRHEQEASGVIDPEVVGKIELQRASDIRKDLGALQMEEGALQQLMAHVTNGTMQPRELAAYPTFLKSPAINALITDLAEVETDRYKLLETRTGKDPEVIALDESANHLESQLLPIARSYSASISQQRTEAQRQFDSLQTKVAALPAIAESGLGLQRDVLRLNQVYAALQAQLVEARLAAISEGGDVHVLDGAVPAKEPSFPNPSLTMGVGVLGGLFAGLIAALLVGALGRWVQDPRDVERRTGVPALRFDPAMPLLINGVTTRTILVVPLDDRAGTSAVARRLAQTAASRSISATVLDLADYKSASAVVPRLSVGNIESVGPVDVAATINRLEAEYGMVIVRLPGLVTDAAAAALHERRPVLLVAPPTRIDREKLVGAVQLLRRIEVPCAGVVLNDAGTDAVLTA
jgi:uncharacterized protein involved in exopolysaccharide biosynthesis